MDKIKLIFKREFYSRVKKKSFVIMALLGPLFFSAMMIIPFWLQKIESEQIKLVAVIDESLILGETLKNDENISFVLIKNKSLEEIQKDFSNSGFYAVLFIPKNVIYSNSVQLFSDRQPDYGLRTYISKVLEKDLETLKLAKSNVPVDLLKSVKNPIVVLPVKWTAQGEELEASIETKRGLALFASFIIYIFVFFYSTQLMRGVVEEKTNRIVEVIISSVKPIKLMAGKVLGIGLVGLTQFFSWVILSFLMIYLAQITLFSDPQIPVKENVSTSLLEQKDMPSKVNAADEQSIEYAMNLFETVKNVNWGIMIFSFVFYFIFGYLLYASLFAAVGSIIDNQTETMQFVAPITLPLVISLVMIQVIINNPDGAVAFWLSIIPFTSPIVMIARIPFGVSYLEVILSMLLLIITFYLCVKMSAKIYRTGILMYGKKITFRELYKWITYNG